MSDDLDISALLRLKRFEQPPPEYFDEFLRDFHRKQREELLKKSVWQIAWNRVEAFFAESRVSQFGYAGATAAVLWFAGASILQAPVDQGGAKVANATVSARATNSGAALSLKPTNNEAFLEALDTKLAEAAAGGSIANQTRYIMDARPASYEPPSSF